MTPDSLDTFLGPVAASGPDAWLHHPFMGEKFRHWHASMVARSRLVEDIVEEQVGRGHDQSVILGAGLPTMANQAVSSEPHATRGECEMDQQGTTPSERDVRVGYEAPRVERMLTPAELEREILYAGIFDAVSAVDTDGGTTF